MGCCSLSNGFVILFPTGNVSAADKLAAYAWKFSLFLVAGLFAHYFGRKVGLWVACVFTVIGLAIQIGTESQGSSMQVVSSSASEAGSS